MCDELFCAGQRTKCSCPEGRQRGVRPRRNRDKRQPGLKRARRSGSTGLVPVSGLGFGLNPAEAKADALSVHAAVAAQFANFEPEQVADH